MIDEREAYLVRIGGAIADMEKANNYLRNILADMESEEGRELRMDGKDQVCWNCDRAVRFEIAGGLRPAFRP